MANSYSTIAPSDLHHVETKAKSTTGRGLFGRVLDALLTMHMRQTERDIAQYVAETGGKFTDESEREIERRFLSPNGR